MNRGVKSRPGRKEPSQVRILGHERQVNQVGVALKDRSARDNSVWESAAGNTRGSVFRQ